MASGGILTGFLGAVVIWVDFLSRYYTSKHHRDRFMEFLHMHGRLG